MFSKEANKIIEFYPCSGVFYKGSQSTSNVTRYFEFLSILNKYLFPFHQNIYYHCISKRQNMFNTLFRLSKNNKIK